MRAWASACSALLPLTMKATALSTRAMREPLLIGARVVEDSPMRLPHYYLPTPVLNSTEGSSISMDATKGLRRELATYAVRRGRAKPSGRGVLWSPNGRPDPLRNAPSEPRGSPNRGKAFRVRRGLCQVNPRVFGGNSSRERAHRLGLHQRSRLRKHLPYRPPIARPTSEAPPAPRRLTQGP